MSGASGENTELLLFPSVLGVDCWKKRLGLAVSLLSTITGVPLDSSALVVVVGGTKLNLGGSLLSKGL